MMPDLDGFSVCSLVRNQSSVPIIFVSAKDTEPDKIAGLTIGSDDYLTKPFSPTELVARVKGIFRRIQLFSYLILQFVLIQDKQKSTMLTLVSPKWSLRCYII